jgi:hypothetical protein
MIWLNPWAWLGLLGVALPIAIHLLGRGHARVVRFPSLRFLDPSRLLPTKRARIQDPLLLACRVAIVAVAALALAQPLLMTSGRRRVLDRGLARAIIVDTSASMRRATIRGPALVDSALTLGASLAAEAQTSVVVPTPDPALAIDGAVAWVAKQARRGEIMIISDFQLGTIDRGDLRGVPSTVGIGLRRIAARDSSGAQLSGANDTTARIRVSVLAGPTDAAELRVLETAATTTVVPLPVDSTRAIAIVFSRYPARASVVSLLKAPRDAWKLQLLGEARRNVLRVAAAGDASIEGKQQFVLLTDAAPVSLEAAQLVSLARRATSIAPAAGELEPESVADADLRAWERSASEASAAQHRPLDANGPSDARWLWAVVLLLLLVEWRLRDTKTATETRREEPARAA